MIKHKSIKKILDPIKTAEWSKQENDMFGAYSLPVGSLVRRAGDNDEETLGIVTKTDGAWAFVQWTKEEGSFRLPLRNFISDLKVLSLG